MVHIVQNPALHSGQSVALKGQLTEHRGQVLPPVLQHWYLEFTASEY